MHFSQRAYVLIMLTAVLAVAGIWSPIPDWWICGEFRQHCCLVGLAIEGLFIRRASVTAEIETASRAFLGANKTQPMRFTMGRHGLYLWNMRR